MWECEQHVHKTLHKHGQKLITYVKEWYNCHLKYVKAAFVPNVYVFPFANKVNTVVFFFETVLSVTINVHICLEIGIFSPIIPFSFCLDDIFSAMSYKKQYSCKYTHLCIACLHLSRVT